MMEIAGNISYIKILSDSLSIWFVVSDSDKNIDHLKKEKKKLLSFTIADNNKRKIWFKGKIISIGLRENAYFVVHTAINKAVIDKLIDMRKELCFIKFGTVDGNSNEEQPVKESQDISNKTEKDEPLDELKKLLNRASEKTGKKKEDILKQVTTFKKDDRVYKGKERPEDLSEKQLIIAIDKIKKFYL